MVPRSSAQPISPSATWAGRIGVARIASYNLAYFSRKKMLNVESYMAPFLEDTATRPGPHRQQVEQRLEDTGREHQPGVPVDPGVPFDQPQAARVAARPLEPGEQAGRRQHPQRDARHAVSPQT